MTHIEAINYVAIIKQALEALENSVDLVIADAYNAEQLYGKYPSRQARVGGLKLLAEAHEQAITSLRQTIAETEKQEPVAWVCYGAVSNDIDFEQDDIDALPVGTMLYTNPFVATPRQPKREPLLDENTVALIKECRDAFAEELSAWDIEPPLHHVKQGHDNCVKWLAAHGIKEKNNGT